MNNTRSSTLKNGKVEFYTGRRKATTDEAKAYIKTQIKEGMSFAPGKLTPELAKYAGSVTGGINRSKSALNNKSGQFLSKRDEEQLQRNLEAMGWNIEALKDLKKVEHLKELLKQTPTLLDSFNELIDEGFVRYYNKNTFKHEAKSWKGAFRVNGKITNSANALRRVNSTLKQMDLSWGIYLAIFKATISGDELLIRLPTESEINEYESSEDFKDGYEWGDDWKIISH